MSGNEGALYKHIWEYFVCWCCCWLAAEKSPCENMFLTHIVFPLRSAAERLRKQWEEEEEERLKQVSVPAEPKSKRRFSKLCF